MDKKAEYSRAIKEEALHLGFDDCGISPVQVLRENSGYLIRWLDKGYHAGMHYLAKNTDVRSDPSKLVQGAKSVISVIINYYSPETQSDPKAPVISKYAYGKDYHRVIKEKLTTLLHFIRETIPGSDGHVFVDSSSVLEKAWAHRSGLGWIGKNSLLLTPRCGSFIYIGELIVTEELEYDKPLQNDVCGTCRKCIEACPTGAIVAEKVIDAGKCIAYNTIENKNEIDPALRNKFANRMFGCDICQNVCPWNNDLTPHKTKEFNPRPPLLNMSAEEWHSLDEKRFNELFGNTVVERTGFTRLKRNIDFVKGNL